MNLTDDRQMDKRQHSEREREVVKDTGTVKHQKTKTTRTQKIHWYLSPADSAVKWLPSVFVHGTDQCTVAKQELQYTHVTIGCSDVQLSCT